MNSDILIDQEFRSIIPSLDEAEYADLEKSLRTEGNRVPIDTWRGYIIDGHNRYDICHKHGLPLKPANELKHLKTRRDVLAWIINNQLGRRNLNNYQRTRLVLKLKSLIAEKARGKQSTEGRALGGNPTLSQKSDKGSVDTKKELAKAARVSHDTVAKVEIIEELATDDQKQKLEDGGASINEVFKQVKPKNEAQQKRMEPKFNRLRELEKQGIYIGSVWDFSKRTNYAGDANFHGNCIPQIVENAILFYTKEGETVLDPMAGSGTTIDVCKQLKRKCLAYDVIPQRDDILKQDARNMQAVASASIDFIFLHPPYWKLVPYSRDGDCLDDISRLSYDAFLTAMHQVAIECDRVLRAFGNIALLIGDMVNAGNFIPISIPIFNDFANAGLTPNGIAIKTTEGSRSQVLKGKTVWAEVAVTNNLKIEHDFVMLFKKDGK